MRPRRLRISVAAILAAGALATASPPQARAGDAPIINTAQIKRDAHSVGQTVKHDSTSFGHRIASSARTAGHRFNADMHTVGHTFQRWWSGFKSSLARARSSASHPHSA